MVKRLTSVLLATALAVSALSTTVMAQDTSRTVTVPLPTVHFDFEEGVGTTLDDIAGTGSAVVSGGATWVEGHKAGTKALQFNGVDSYATISGVKDFAVGWTMSMWVKRDVVSTTEDVALLGSSKLSANGGSAYWLLTNNYLGDKMALSLEALADNGSQYTLPKETWVNLTIVAGTDKLSYYENGVFKSSNPYHFGYQSDLPLGYIAAHSDIRNSQTGPMKGFFKGAIDDIKVYNTELTQTQVIKSVGEFEKTLTVVGGTTNNGTTGKYIIGSDVSITADPASDGQAFSHWTTSDGGSFEDANSATTTFSMAATDVTVTAHYVVATPHVVTFDSQGGTEVAPQTVAFDQKIKQPANPTKAENDKLKYVFDGWYTSATGGVKFDMNQLLTQDVTLYAQWIAQHKGDAPKVKVMALGDSITAGAGSAGGYRLELWRNFVSAGMADYIDFVGSQNDTGNPALPDGNHEGHISWTIDPIQWPNSSDYSSGLSTYIDGWMDAYTPEIVLLQIGTNDASSEVANMPERLGNLIDKICAKLPANGKVYVAKIPPASPDYHPDIMPNFNKCIDAYNAAIPGVVESKVAQGKHVYLADMHSILNVSDLGDGVHPNATGYRKMGDQWFNTIKDIFATTPDFVVKSQITATDNETAFKAIDGNPMTTWKATNSTGSITLDLGSEMNVNKIGYMPPQDGSAAAMTQYEVLTSVDGENFVPATSGTWANNTAYKEATFEATAARYVRLAPKQSSVVGAAEINVYGTPVAPVVPGNVTKDDLVALVSYAKAQKALPEYNFVVPAVKSALDARIISAEAIIANANATQAQVDLAYTSLMDVVQMLSFTGNNTTLLEKYNAWKDFDPAMYTSASAKALTDALAIVKPVIDNQNALQSEIDTALTTLESAINGLVKDTANKDALRAQIGKANKYNENLANYIDNAGKTEFIAALANAKAVEAQDSSTQAEIDAACTRLMKAIWDLREIPNKDKLQELINQANAFDVTGYTASSVKARAAAISYAQAVMDDPMATQEDVDAAIAGIKTTTANLVLVTDEKTDDKETTDTTKDETTDKTEDTKVPTTSDTTPLALAFAFAIAMAGCACVVVRKKVTR